MIKKKGLIVSGMIFAAAFAHAGTVIDTNLGAGGVAIVNINSTSDGANNWLGSQDQWTDPFSTTNTPLEVTVGPGTYTFNVVNSVEAQALNPMLTAGQLSEIYTAWSYGSAYDTDYCVWNSSALTTSGTPDLFIGASTQDIPNELSYTGASRAGFDNATDAYNAAVESGISNKIWVTGRVTGTEESSYTFSTQTTLVFGVPDNQLYDNIGGVSVYIQSVPEPSALLLLVPTFGVLIARRLIK